MDIELPSCIYFYTVWCFIAVEDVRVGCTEGQSAEGFQIEIIYLFICYLATNKLQLVLRRHYLCVQPVKR